MLSGLSDVVCELDGYVLVFGSSEQEHNEHLCKVLRIMQKCDLTLNEKYEFAKRSVRFLGDIIDANGVRADADKVSQGFPTGGTRTPKGQNSQGLC